MIINIDTPNLPHYCGDTIAFNEGILSISGYDGITELSKDKARELAEALKSYYEKETSF